MKTPTWLEEINKKYRMGISNAFVVTGNIGDYVGGRYLIHDYLLKYLAETMHIDNVVEYNVANGLKHITGDIESDYSGSAFGTACKALYDTNKSTAVVWTYPEYIFPNTPQNLSGLEKAQAVELHMAMNSSAFLSSDNIVIFLTESITGINSIFLNSNSKTSICNIGLPDYDTRLDFINQYLKQLKNDDHTTWSKMDFQISAENLATLTSGLSLINIDDILLTASSDDVMCLSRNMVIERKAELIRKEFGEIIEIFDTDGFSLDKFAGQEHLKQYFKDVVIDAVANGDREIVPKGVLLMGPPGTGKTYFSRCLAGDAGINFVEFKMSKILDKWVGESEKRMEKALNVFRALAPVGIFMDEVDQTLGRNADGSGHEVQKNLFGMLLAEMSKPENRGRLIWLGATNYPNNIDEALKRPGRFDKKIPFFAPNYNDRKEVFRIHLKKHVADDSEIDYDSLALATDGYTQAEIEGIVVKAVELAHRDKTNQNKYITMKHLNQALSYMSSNQNFRIKDMEEIALSEVNDLEFVPPEYMEKYKGVEEKAKESPIGFDFGEVSRGRRK